MPKRNFTTLEEFKANLHREGATLVEFSGKKIPCLLIGSKEHDQLLQKVYGKAILAEPVLDIFYDGRDVFVDVQIKFAKTDFDKNYLLYANGMLEFFEALAETGLLGIAPDTHVYSNSQNMFTIQLARTEPAKNALEIIKANSKRGSDKNE
jgi:hypothetical protein